mmetsp:Transcript_30693/g.45432  ORF Transcript_30693/g.45432 Transcript_30693/m.45432 type:complete len:237 (+) Transcript_30693:55-765(+)
MKFIVSIVTALSIWEGINVANGFTTKFVTHRNPTSDSRLFAVKIDGYDEAFEIINECSTSGTPSEELFDAVRFIDRNSLKIYPDEEHKQALWDEAHGSWKLQMATGGGKFKQFKKVPIFAFAMVDDLNFGNGVGWNEDNIILSLLGPHVFSTRKRQMVITIDDLFLFAANCSYLVPGFIRDGMGLGKGPQDFKGRPPAFVFIGASDKALIARGGTGGIAIWTRLSKDIRPAAYGSK